MATHQDTIIPPTTPDLDLLRIKEWERLDTPRHPVTAASIHPNTGPPVPTGTPEATGPAARVPTAATPTPDKAPLPAGVLPANMTRTPDPTQTRRCTAGDGTARGIRPGRAIQEVLRCPRQVRREDNQLKQTTIPPVSSTRTNSRREELDLGVPPAQEPGPPAQADHQAQGSCRGPLSRDTLEVDHREVDLLEDRCLHLEGRGTPEALRGLLTHPECLLVHSPSTLQGLL